MNSRRTIKLSVGITAHNEGVLAHKTMTSVFNALTQFKAKGYTYEIVIHIDSGDEETNNYFERYTKDKSIVIIKNHFCSLGQSRNCIAQHARGEFLTFLDADDLISSNWYVNALQVLQNSNDDVLVHPNAQFKFGINSGISYSIAKGTRSKYQDTIDLIGASRWCFVVMGRTKIFLDFPYMENKAYYGREDYCFNADTVKGNIRHLIAPNTVVFYRQKIDGALLTEINIKNLIRPYSKLFDIKEFQSLPMTEPTNVETLPVIDKKQCTNHLGTIRPYISSLKNRAASVARLTTKIVRKIHHQKPTNTQVDNLQRIPLFLLNEWEDIHKIESQLYPTQEMMKEFFQENYNACEIGFAYRDLTKDITDLPHLIFIVPWVKSGGADKVLLNYLKAIKKLRPSWRIAVITTLATSNSWQVKLPSNSYLIDFGNRAQSLNGAERDILFSRLIVQLQCKKLHIINSQYGYDWIALHKESLKDQYSIDVSIFSVANELIPWFGSYDSPCITRIYGLVHKIFTDNKRVISDMAAQQGFDTNKMQVVYQPIDATFYEHNISKKQSKLHILWASRISDEKLPNIIGEIAKELDASAFHIDVYGSLSDNYSATMFDEYENIKYCGEYDGFSSIDTEKYDLFLYTSLRDGLPNVILEAATDGLPIIAPDVGGINEFIQNKQTGVLINDPRNAKAYATAVREAHKHPIHFRTYAINAQKLLQSQHSWENFINNIKEYMV